MTDKYMISMSAGGISNRLKCLISVLRFSEKYSRKSYLVWERNHTCGANFNDLFKTKMDMKDSAFVNKIRTSDISTDINSKESLNKKYIILNGWRLSLSYDELDKYPHLKEKHNLDEWGLDYNFKNIPEKIKKEIIKHFKKFKPVDVVQKKIDKFVKDHDLKKLVGVHIRRGDFASLPISPGRVSSDKYFIKKMREILEKDPKTKFFLSTDSPEVEKKYEELFEGKIVKYSKNSFVRTDVAATQESLVDLMLLSKTKKILGTYKSTFTEVAWWLGLCKPEVEMVVDPQREREYFINNRKNKRRIIPKIKKFILRILGRRSI